MAVYEVSMVGVRKANEDQHIVFLNSNNDDQNFAKVNIFAIMDGHGGKEIAIQAKKYIEKYFKNPKLTYPIDQQQVFKIFDRIQTHICEDKKKEAVEMGSTCLCAINYKIGDDRFLQVVNIGDSRAVLCRDGVAIPLTKDHKPNWPEERKRIEYINKNTEFKEQIYFDGIDWRIKDLSVSRAFGDLDSVPYVTHIPDVFYYKIEPRDKFILLACDGIWDVLSNQEVVNFILDHLDNPDTTIYNIPRKYPKESKGDNNIAKKLAEYAIARGSLDNITAILIVFGYTTVLDATRKV